MLTLDIRRHGEHAQVEAHCAGTTVDLGFLNESQLELLRKGLAASLERLEEDLASIRLDAADRIYGVSRICDKCHNLTRRKQDWKSGTILCGKCAGGK